VITENVGSMNIWYLHREDQGSGPGVMKTWLAVRSPVYTANRDVWNLIRDIGWSMREPWTEEENWTE
jgi:hypothetical protein